MPDARRDAVALCRTGIGRGMTAHHHVNADVWLDGPDGRVLANHAVPSLVTWPAHWGKAWSRIRCARRPTVLSMAVRCRWTITAPS